MQQPSQEANISSTVGAYFYKNPMFSDFTFRFNSDTQIGEEISVHRFILVHRSTYFRSLFEGNWNDSNEKSHYFTEGKKIVEVFVYVLYHDHEKEEDSKEKLEKDIKTFSALELMDLCNLLGFFGMDRVKQFVIGFIATDKEDTWSYEDLCVSALQNNVSEILTLIGKRVYDWFGDCDIDDFHGYHQDFQLYLLQTWMLGQHPKGFGWSYKDEHIALMIYKYLFYVRNNPEFLTYVEMNYCPLVSHIDIMRIYDENTVYNTGVGVVGKFRAGTFEQKIDIIRTLAEHSKEYDFEWYVIQYWCQVRNDDEKRKNAEQYLCPYIAYQYNTLGFQINDKKRTIDGDESENMKKMKIEEEDEEVILIE